FCSSHSTSTPASSKDFLKPSLAASSAGCCTSCEMPILNESSSPPPPSPPEQAETASIEPTATIAVAIFLRRMLLPFETSVRWCGSVTDSACRCHRSSQAMEWWPRRRVMRRQRSDRSEAMTYITSNVMISTLWPGTDTGCRLGVLETIVPVSLSDATDVLSGLDLDVRSSEHIEHPGEVERCLLPGVIAAGGTAVPGDHLRLEQGLGTDLAQPSHPFRWFDVEDP